jgi:hypothetical protein
LSRWSRSQIELNQKNRPHQSKSVSRG